MNTKIDSISEDGVANNVMRHEYKVLSELEKVHMKAIKDKGAEFYGLIEEIEKATNRDTRIASYYSSRELSLAKTKIEEAVMWAVKEITK